MSAWLQKRTSERLPCYVRFKSGHRGCHQHGVADASQVVGGWPGATAFVDAFRQYKRVGHLLERQRMGGPAKRAYSYGLLILWQRGGLSDQLSRFQFAQAHEAES